MLASVKWYLAMFIETHNCVVTQLVHKSECALYLSWKHTVLQMCFKYATESCGYNLLGVKT